MLEHIPQTLVLLLLAVQVLGAVKLDGKERTPHSFKTELTNAIIWLSLLWFGGYFKP